jgi:TolB-like protein
VSCSFRIQRTLADINADLSDHRHINFRIGIHLGDVMGDGERLYGDGVNIAARLEALAAPGGICISDLVYRQVQGKLDQEFIDMGDQKLKNIPESVRAFRSYESGTTLPTAPATHPKQPWLMPPARSSLAVLPFVNLGDDPGQDHFAIGLTLDIQTALVLIPGLFLIGEETMLSYSATPMPLRDLGKRLGVSHVLDGGVRRAGNRIRVTARLFETTGGRQVWAERYDRDLDDIFFIQDEITMEIVTAMDVQLVSGEPGRIIRHALKNNAAIEAYYRGWGALLGSAAEDITFAQQMFEETVRLEPESSLGYAMAAWSYWLAVDQRVSEDKEHSLNRAEAMARQALQLEDITRMAELVLAEIHLYKKEYDQALAASERAVLTRPSCGGSFAIKANVLNYLGRPAEAVDPARYAMRLSPVYPAFYPTTLATACYGSDRFEEAIEAAELGLDIEPENVDALLVLVAANAALERLPQAREAAEKVRRAHPDFAFETYAARQPYKDPQPMERMLDRLRKAGL